MNEWRVQVTNHYSFALDQVHLVIGRVQDGMLYPIKPIEFEFLPGIPMGTSFDGELPVTVISRELAEQLVHRISFCLLGVDDPVNEIIKLRGELARTHRQLENLIDGIGRIGGNGA